MAQKQPIAPNESRLYSIDAIIRQYRFAIPGFQRLYAWGKREWNDLIGDLRETSKQNKSLFLGMAVIGKDQNDEYLIIDGQQRLTTIALLLHALNDPEFVPQAVQKVHEAFIRPQATDASYFFKILFEKNAEEPKTYSQRLMREAVGHFRASASDIAIKHIREGTIIVYCAENVQKGTSLYERVNLRGLDVAKIEIVKNRLFDIAGRNVPQAERAKLEDDITTAFTSIYVKLNPPASCKTPVNLDTFLNVHWILYALAQPKTTDFKNLYDFVDREVNKDKVGNSAVAGNIRQYIRELDRFASAWRKIISPNYVEIQNIELRDALLSLLRVRRDGAFTPLIAAALLAWGETKETADFIRLCEAVNFRQALVGNPSHSGRSRRWGIARDIMQKGYSYKDAVNAVFWDTCPWWDAEEMLKYNKNENDGTPDTKFAAWRIADDSNTYNAFRYYLHYFFWEYALWLDRNPIRANQRRAVDIPILNQQLWEEVFRVLEVEHIFPQNPDKSKIKKYAERHIKRMKQRLHSLGNLTLIPSLDNKEMLNYPFEEKLNYLLSKEIIHLNFNDALKYKAYTGRITDGVWSVDNCIQRAGHLLKFAQERWGTAFLASYPIDNSYERSEGHEDDEADDDLSHEIL